MKIKYWRKRLNYASRQIKFIVGFISVFITFLCLGIIVNSLLFKIPGSFIESLLSETIAGALVGTIVGFFLIHIGEQSKKDKEKEDAVFHANRLMDSIMELEARGKIPLVISGPTKNLLGSEINSLYDIYKLFEKNIFLIKRSIKRHPTVSALDGAINLYKMICLITEDFDDLLRKVIRQINYKQGVDSINDSRDLIYVRSKLFSKGLKIKEATILEELDLPKKLSRLEKLYLTISKDKRIIKIRDEILVQREKLNNELVKVFKSANY